jgi:hypothetical protein
MISSNGKWDTVVRYHICSLTVLHEHNPSHQILCFRERVTLKTSE